MPYPVPACDHRDHASHVSAARRVRRNGRAAPRRPRRRPAPAVPQLGRPDDRRRRPRTGRPPGHARRPGCGSSSSCCPPSAASASCCTRCSGSSCRSASAGWTPRQGVARRPRLADRPQARTRASSWRCSRCWSALAILVDKLHLGAANAYVWPMLLIGAGVALVWRQADNARRARWVEMSRGKRFLPIARGAAGVILVGRRGDRLPGASRAPPATSARSCRRRWRCWSGSRCSPARTWSG